MILTLEITGPREGAPWAEPRKVFHATGGTIGRLPDNDWVLPDPYVSSRHARVRFADGAFLIEDTSTNGVYINSPDQRLVRGQPYALKSGDRIFIDPYEIRASISAEPARADEDPFALPGVSSVPPQAAFAPSSAPPSYASPLPEVGPLGPAEDVDPLRALGFDSPKPAASHVPRAADLAGSSLLSEHYQPPSPAAPPPAPAAPQSLIPADYDPLGPEPRSQAVAPPPPPARVTPERRAVPEVRPAAPAPGRGAPAGSQMRPAAAVAAEGEATLAAVLAGAGVDSSVVTPELARSFGQILRVVVSGVIDVLQARQRIKDEFRMRMTAFKPMQNNPLKFSVNVDDALYNLLVKRNPAFLGPVEAFEDAFDDIKNHQMAMLAGVRVAFEAMLAEFHPDRLQEEFDKQGKGSLIAVPGKLRYWDQYCDRFNDMVSDADAAFRELFGHEFAKAYEEQLERLKARERARTP
jgi:type VI secretion system FHA domain protein